MQPFADSAVEPVADTDIEPIADPMDVELVTDPMDVEPVTDLMDVKQIADPDVEPVMDSIDVEQIADPDFELVKDRMDTSPRWETPGLCRTCIQAKQQQHIVRTRAPRSSIPFELVHSDLCGPMKHSIGGAQYYIILTAGPAGLRVAGQG